MGKRCPGDVAANPRPMPALLHLGPETHTQLHARMYQKHLDTEPESAYMRPEGSGTRRTPRRWKWLSKAKLAGVSRKYPLLQAGSWEKEAEGAPRKAALSEHRAAPATLQWEACFFLGPSPVECSSTQ